MTISTASRKSGPLAGNGVTTVFGFSYKVFTTDQVQVIETTDGVETVLAIDVDYTISLNSNQNSNPGGNVTMLAAPATGTSITILSDVPYTQPTDFGNLSGFYPNIHADAFDRATILVLQLMEQIGRAIKVPASSDASANLPMPEANSVIGWNGAGDGLTNYTQEVLSSGVISEILEGMAAATFTSGDFVEATGASAFRGRKLITDTYVALQAIPAASRFDGMVCFVSSRAAANDGGEGFFRFVAASAAADDGGTVLAPTAGTGRWLRVIYGDEYRLSWWGATHAAFVAAVAAAKTAEAWLDGSGATVTLTSLLTLSGAGKYKWCNLRYQKLTQTAGNGENAITITGPNFNSPRTLAANASVGATSITLNDASGLAAGDVMYLVNDTAYAPAYTVITVVTGEWLTISAVNTGTGVVTLSAPLQSSYTTANTARTYKFNQTCEVWMKNVSAYGGGLGLQQGGMRLNWCTIRQWDNMQSYDNEYQSFEWQICVDKYQKGTTYSEGSTLDGYGYGQVEGGCYNAHFTSVTGRGARHMYTAGASVQATLTGGSNVYLFSQGGNVDRVFCSDARGDPFDVHFGCRGYWAGHVGGNMLPGTGESALTLQSADIVIDNWCVIGGDQGAIIQCWGKPSDEPAPYFTIGSVEAGRGGTSTNWAFAVENFDSSARRPMNISVGSLGGDYPGLVILDCEQGDINMYLGHLKGRSRTTHTISLISYRYGRPRLTVGRNDAIEDSGNAAVYMVNADGTVYESFNANVFGAFCDILSGHPTADNTAYYANDAIITLGKSRGTISKSQAGIGLVLPGTFTPSGAVVTNLDSCTPGLCNITQEGDTVRMEGVVTLNATATGDITASITPPIPSDFTNSTDAFGVATATSGTGYGGVFADAATNTLRISGNTNQTDDRVWRYSLTYRVK